MFRIAVLQGELTINDMQQFPAFIDKFALAMQAAIPPLELHVYTGWEHQATTKNVSGHMQPWRAHWFNYSLEGGTQADFIDVGLTYDYSQQAAGDDLNWRARLECVLGRITSWYVLSTRTSPTTIIV